MPPIAKLDLKYLSPVSEGSKEQTAFDQLVLPKQHKDIVYCLVDQHFRNKEARVSDNEEVDIIRGKGCFVFHQYELLTQLADSPYRKGPHSSSTRFPWSG